MRLESITIRELNHYEFSVGSINYVLPSDFRDVPLFLFYIDYMHSPKFKVCVLDYRVNIAREVISFIGVASDQIIQHKAMPEKIFNTYMQFIKGGVTGNTVRSRLNWLLYPLRLYGEERSVTSEYWREEFLQLLYKAPVLKGSNTTPNPDLVSMFTNTPYDNTEAIKSLRSVCCYIILKFDEKRKLFIKHPNVKGFAIEAYRKSTDSFPLMGIPSTHIHDQYKNALRLHAPLFNAVIEENDNWVLERLSHNYPPPLWYMPQENDSLTRNKSWFKKWVRLPKKTNQYTVKTAVVVDKKKTTHTATNGYILNDIYGLSHEQVFAMQCLLASERIQSSGIRDLCLKDIVINDKGVQIGYGKRRRGIDSATLIYRKGSLIYKAYSTFIDRFKEQHTGENPLLIQYHKDSGKMDILGQLGLTSSRMQKFFTDMVNEKTELHNNLMKEVGEDANPFLFYVKNLISHNHRAKKGHASYGTDSNVVEGVLSLSINAIAMSRVRMDDKIDNTSNKEVDQKLNEELGAELTAQSLATKKNVYNARSNSPEKIKSLRSFASQVGDSMEQDALLVSDLFNKTKVLDMKSFKKELGINDSAIEAEDLYELIEKELGDVIGDIGDIELNNKRVVVATPLTAALIISKIKHIEKELPRIKVDHEKKAVRFKAHHSYLTLLLDEFSQSILAEGKAKSKKFSFPFASLI
ncbi:hypothetical protein ESZ36_12615 [Colwellia demingiae]|uniref:Uncharacterized protein n=1 Tax=Colwellia demingiae TaxID=89401 RepID=A0A5C6QDU0_9GAMM|nr:hypothetical protein [Colwellia demingiae]TWX67154.1 hypothetical protein ESZ36_12615 [Colwellia demingiae]